MAQVAEQWKQRGRQTGAASGCRWKSHTHTLAAKVAATLMRGLVPRAQHSFICVANRCATQMQFISLCARLKIQRSSEKRRGG